MTQSVFAAEPSRATDNRVITLVSAAHFISHVFIFVLPPLFPFVRAEFGVSYTELGIAIAMFNVLTGTLQTPAGFLTDRTSPRLVLVAAVLLGALGYALCAVAPVFLAFCAAYALVGIANAVYHPADYAILSGRVSAPRMSQAYSVHIFAGFAGTAVSPVAMVFLAETTSWRGALFAAAAIGAAIAIALMAFGALLDQPAHKAAQEKSSAPTDWRVLTSSAVLLNLVFFMLLAVTGGGIATYGIVALEALWTLPLSLATGALTSYFVFSALAVLAGGMLSARTDRHDLVAVIGLALSAIALLPVAFFDMPPLLLIACMGLSGFFTGMIMPSRDMLVRSVTPPGSFGKVFGFITTGFNIGNVLAPLAFGFLMDHGSPRGVILGAAACAVITIPIVLVTRRTH